MPPLALPFASMATEGADHVFPLSVETEISMLPSRMKTQAKLPSSVDARWGWIAPPPSVTASRGGGEPRSARKAIARSIVPPIRGRVRTAKYGSFRIGDQVEVARQHELVEAQAALRVDHPDAERVVGQFVRS